MLLKHCTKTLKCDIGLFNKNINELDNPTDKEKLLIFHSYYNFIKNEKYIKLIENSIEVIKQSKVNLNDDDLTTLIIIIFKSFLNKASIDNIRELYINSNDIFNYTVEHYKYYLILSKRFMTKKSIEVLCLYVIDLLAKKELIKEKIIVNRSKFIYKTIKYYFIENISYIKKIDEYMIFSYKDYELIEFEGDYYITTGHFSKTFELFKKNFNSNKGFRIKNLNYILNKINIKLYIDSEYQQSLKTLLNIRKEGIINEIKKNTNKINNLYESVNWTPNMIEEISAIQSQNSQLLELILYDFFANYDFKNNYIFFPMFLDFRGRKYYYSRIGPTSSKILRLSFFYGWYDQSEFNDSDCYYSQNYSDIINLFCKKYNIPNKKCYYETYFWVLIGIGKYYINKSNYPVTVKEFLNCGLMYYNNLNKQLDLDEKLEILHYRRIISEITDDRVKKRAIIKDATASLNQIFMKKLGPLDQNSLDYVNLGEKWEWYDTYTITKDLFYEYIKEDKIFVNKWDKQSFEKVFKRPLLKNPVMIIPYSAGNQLCWENYQEMVTEKKYDIKITQELKKLMIKFYNFIRHDMQELYLYKKTSTNLVNKISEDFETLRKFILESETGEADISYYKMKKSSIDKKYKLNGENKRVTKLVLTPSKALDKKAFQEATGANVVHFLDADEIRIIEHSLGYSVITIHDSYLIDFKNCSKLIKIKIEHYQKEIDKITPGYKINNIFILL